MVLLERFHQPELESHVPANPLADDEGDLVLGGQIAGIDERDLDLGRAGLEGDGVTASGDFGRQQLQDVVGDPPKILRCRTRGALLLREGAAELLFAQRFDLEQTGSEPPPDDLLIAQRAQELVPRDLATLLEKLTQAECSSAQRTS